MWRQICCTRSACGSRSCASSGRQRRQARNPACSAASGNAKKTTLARCGRREGQDGRLYDLGTKGSGRPPWSRGGDGRLTLKGGVREVLATSMLEALGVDTSKSLSLIETGRIDVSPIVARTVALSQATEELKAFDGPTEPGVAVITEFAG